LYFLSTGSEDHGRQRIGRCTGGSADPFSVRNAGPSHNRNRAPARSGPRYPWFLHCLPSIVSAEPASLIDRVSPKLGASVYGPEVINEEALTVPDQAWVSFVAADQTSQARRVRWTGAEQCQRPRNRRCLALFPVTSPSERASARAGWPPSRSGRPYRKAMHQGDPDSDLSQGQRHEKLHGSGTAEGSLSRHVRRVERERYCVSSEPTVRVVPDVTVGKWLTALIKRVLLGRRLSRWSHSSASWWRPPGRARLCSRP
jgi:hypothetical protein